MGIILRTVTNALLGEHGSSVSIYIPSAFTSSLDILDSFGWIHLDLTSQTYLQRCLLSGLHMYSAYDG